MKKAVYITSLILILSLTLLGQPAPMGPGPHEGGPRGPRHRGRADFDRRLGHDPLQFFRKAGIILTEEQAAKMYDIAIKFITEEEPIRFEI